MGFKLGFIKLWVSQEFSVFLLFSIYKLLMSRVSSLFIGRWWLWFYNCVIYTWLASFWYFYVYACCNIDHRRGNGIYEYWCNKIMTWMYDLDVLLMCDWDCLPRSSTLTWIRLPYSDMLTGLIVKFWHVNSLTLGSVRGPTMWWIMWIVILIFMIILNIFIFMHLL